MCQKPLIPTSYFDKPLAYYLILKVPFAKTNLFPGRTGNVVDVVLFRLHPAYILCHRGGAVDLGGLEPEDLGQTHPVGCVFHHAQLDADITHHYSLQ